MSVLESATRLTRDQRAAAATLGNAEARFLVDQYYTMQKNRISANNQIRSADEQEEPHLTLSWLADNSQVLEQQLKGALEHFSKSHPQGEWAISNKGIGPVITAGLLSRLQLRPTVGHWWSFAGLNPTAKWNKGEKRPWNADLKRLCWLIGESFVKVSGDEEALYGQIYKTRKSLEIERNEAGLFADQAKTSMAEKRYGVDTKALARYKEGKLPDARLHLRAERYATKIFLSHLHAVWYFVETGLTPPKPYVLEHLGHAHPISVPNAHLIPGLTEALRRIGM